MPTDTSATLREETPHATDETLHTINSTEHDTLAFDDTPTAQVNFILRQRAESLVKDKSINGTVRAMILYGLLTNDPALFEIVRRVDAGEPILEGFDFSQTPAPVEEDFGDEKIEALTEMICRAGDEPAVKSAALLVLMATLENSTHSKALSNIAKHAALSRCSELGRFSRIDAQIALLESKLFAGELHA